LIKLFVSTFAWCLLFNSCSLSTDVFEKNIPIPGQQWYSEFKPEIDFDITDTVSLYNIYLVLRHSDAYNYNNIWINARVRQPGEAGVKSQRYDLTLATNNKGWLGSAMDDIYEHRILIQPQTKFKNPGAYHFTVEQVMREDPLLHVLDVGIRIEKAE
jgi:gliding motility-associated lipoprotein GldH